jgi:signal transduction histidine kinase
VTNAIKHAKARNVEIRVRNGGNHLLLSIHNDGASFPSVVRADAGLGLRIMSYRAHLIGATFDVKPGETEGAVVTCSLPVSS